MHNTGKSNTVSCVIFSPEIITTNSTTETKPTAPKGNVAPTMTSPDDLPLLEFNSDIHIAIKKRVCTVVSKK